MIWVHLAPPSSRRAIERFSKKKLSTSGINACRHLPHVVARFIIVCSRDARSKRAKMDKPREEVEVAYVRHAMKHSSSEDNGLWPFDLAGQL